MKVALAHAWQKKIHLNIYVTCLFGRHKSIKIIMLTGLGRTFAHRTFSTSNVIEFSRFFCYLIFKTYFRSISFSICHQCHAEQRISHFFFISIYFLSWDFLSIQISIYVPFTIFFLHNYNYLFYTSLKIRTKPNRMQKWKNRNYAGRFLLFFNFVFFYFRILCISRMQGECHIINNNNNKQERNEYQNFILICQKLWLA